MANRDILAIETSAGGVGALAFPAKRFQPQFSGLYPRHLTYFGGDPPQPRPQGADMGIIAPPMSAFFSQRFEVARWVSTERESTGAWMPNFIFYFRC